MGFDDPNNRRTRRASGARTPVSDPVVFTSDDRRVEGWALNISVGGLRAILDEPVDEGEHFEVAVGEEDARSARIVWVREERGGVIVGVAFDDADDGEPPPPPETDAP